MDTETSEDPEGTHLSVILIVEVFALFNSAPCAALIFLITFMPMNCLYVIKDVHSLVQDKNRFSAECKEPSMKLKLVRAIGIPVTSLCDPWLSPCAPNNQNPQRTPGIGCFSL